MPEGFRIASAWVEVSPDDSGFAEKLQAQLDAAVASARADAKVGLDTSELDAAADEARAKLEDLGQAEARPSATLDTSDLDARADDARAKLDELDGKTATPRLGLDDTEFQEKLERDKAEADAAGADSGGGGLIGAVALGASSLLPGIGGAAAGMGLLAGTSALAFSGVAKALSAHDQATQTVGTTSQQLASTAFSNTVQIQQAQQAVGDAYRQASEDGVSSSEQIASAQASLAETTRNAASSQIQALEAVTQAGQQLKDAEFGEQQAQENLTNARIQARLTLQQLNDAQADSVLSTRAAQLALQQAQLQQSETDQNAMSTQLDREQAALAVAQAQRQLIEAQQNQVNSAQAAQRADKQGVEGSQQVVQAKHDVTDATQAVGNAQQAQADAQRNLTNTELNNAQQIQQAQQAVTQAEQQAAFTQQRDAEAIATAQRNLSNTYKEQQLQAAATASTGNQAASQFAKDMAGMSPQARAFTNELLSMSGAWHHLQSIAQAAVLPGMTVFLRGVQAVMPEVDAGVQRMGQAMSSSFGGFGRLMQTSAFKDGLAGLISNGIRFSQIVLPAFAQFIQELGKIGAQKGASDGLAELLAGIAHGLTGVAAGIAPYTTQINQFLEAVGHIIAAIGPPLGRIVGLIATTLGPLDRYLDSHPNGTVVKVLGDIVAGLLAFRGLQKIVSGPIDALMAAPGRLKEAWATASAIPGKISTAWGVVASVPGRIGGAFTSVFGAGGIWDGIRLRGMAAWEGITGAASSAWSGIEAGAGRVVSTMGRWGGQLGEILGSAAGSVGGWAVRFGSSMASAVTSGAQFVVQFAKQLGEAAVATGAWIAEHAIAAGSFIAENIVMAASATAAFVAENAASLGLVAAIAAIVAAIIFLATHWQQVWGDVKQWAEDAWNFLKDGFDKYIMPYFGPNGFIGEALSALSQRWSQIWAGIKSATHTVVADLGAVWGTLEGIFKAPVNFLIGTVYDNGIRRLWDDVVGAIGLGSLKLPEIAKLSSGGRLDGYGGGDIRPALLEPGETVVSKEDSRRPVMRAAFEAVGVPGYSGGGIIGDITGAISGIGHDVMSAAKFAGEVVSDPGKAVTDLLGKVIGTTAAGELGRVMTGIPRAILGDLAKAVGHVVTTSGGMLPGGSSNAVGDLPANYRQIASFLAAHGFTKFAAAGVAGNIDAESGGNPEILQIGGGGGGGLIQWTPYPAGYITGNAAQDLITQLFAITRWGGGPGQVNRATSPSNAAQIYQDLYERPASLTATIGRRMASANAVYKAMGWGKFDDGGWLMPDTVPVNHTGKPEAVLDPVQSAALVRLAGHAAGQGGEGTAPTVNLNYFGTQRPTPEQKALQMRDLALALSGAGG